MSGLGLPVLVWWLATSLIGLAALPIAWRLFPSLPDRGYAFARPIGLLAAGYAYWLGGLVGLVPNNGFGAWMVAVALILVGLWIARSDRAALRAGLLARRRLLVGYELLYLVAFLAWALYRAYNPNIETSGGEKYMEMAFLSAVVESPSFPPLDPWLAGHSISYYYFGYIIAGFLVQLTGVLRFVAFNLIVPMTLGMTLLGAFGLGYNLVALGGPATRAWRVTGGAFTGFLLALAGSLHGAVELGFMRGWGPAAFYDWLDIKNLTVGPGTCPDEAGSGFGAGGWVPSRFIWWWRGSRVIHDQCREVIHEFPFFSFMLADAHPHVLALPYVLLALGLALAVLGGSLERWPGRPLWSPQWLVLPLVVGALGFLNTWDLPTYGFIVVLAYAGRNLARPAAGIAFDRRPADAFLAFVGALGAFALAWRATGTLLAAYRGIEPADVGTLPKLLGAGLVTVAVLTLLRQLWRMAGAGDAGARRSLDTLRFTVWLAFFALLFYLPFHLGFQSQVTGIGLVDIRSRLPQWLVHFGLLYFLAASLVAVYLPALRGRLRRPSPASQIILVVALALAVLGLWWRAWVGLMLVLTLALAGITAIELWLAALASPRGDDGTGERGGQTAGGQANGMTAESDVAATVARPEIPANQPDRAPGTEPPPAGIPTTTVAATFALICVAVGLLMPLGTEIVFVRDLFNNRMNTVFKLFYQGWTLLAVGGGYALFAVHRQARRSLAWAWSVPLALLVAGSLVYPLASVHTRTNGFTVRADGGPESGLSLDGLRWWKASHPEDLEAALWLMESTPKASVILEAFGGGYAHNARLAMASGRPNVLGWEGHEHQWRGTREEIDPRKADIEAIYTGRSEEAVRALLDRYSVDYVVVGDLERSQFNLSGADEARFERFFGPPVWSSSGGKVRIYARD